MNVAETIVAAEGAATSVLPIPPIAYGLLAFGAMMGLLFITYAFRSVGTRL